MAVAAVGGLIGGVGYYGLQLYFNHDPCARWNWKDAVFWGGVGTGIGALLGIGTYGGWWVGAQLGWWGAAVWKLDPFARGWAIEKIIGRGELLKDLPGFPTIDRFENGIATSIKSIDLGAKTYQNVGALTSRVQDYIDELANFPGARYGGVNITRAMIRGRKLILAVPRNASAAQIKALQQLAGNAANQGVNFVTKVIK